MKNKDLKKRIDDASKKYLNNSKVQVYFYVHTFKIFKHLTFTFI